MSILVLYHEWILVSLLWLCGLLFSLVETLLPGSRRWTSWVSLLVPCLAMGLLALIWSGGTPRTPLGSEIRVDGYALFIQAAVFLLLLCSLLLGRHLGARWRLGSDGLLFLCAAGISLLVVANDLLLVLAGWIGTLFPLWGLSALSPGNGREAALKGLLAGILATALLGLGAALVFFQSSSTTFQGIRDYMHAAAQVGSVPKMFAVGLALILTGLGVFVAAVPFHMWFTDMVDGFPLPGSLMLSGGVMAAGLASLGRVLLVGFGPAGTPASHVDYWTSILHGVGLAALLICNALALIQPRLKRMAAYLAAGQAGLVMITLAAVGKMATSPSLQPERMLGGILVFLAVHALNWVGLFVAIGAIEDRQGQDPRIHHLYGLGQRHPWLAGAVGLALLCMAGMPLTAGFFSRLYLLDAMVSAGWTGTAIAAALSLGLVLVMSLGVVAAMVMHPPGEDLQVRITPALVVMAVISSITVLVLGILPGGVLDVAIHSAAAIMGSGR